MISTLLAVALALTPASASAHSAVNGDLQAYLDRTLHTADYRIARADLNGDGIKEVVVYVADDRYCGTGGCKLLILEPLSGGGYRRVMDATITRPPIRQLSTRSHGWSDIGVLVVGGGIMKAYEARLRFDGRAYPSNPTVPAAKPVENVQGRTLIGPAAAAP